MFSRFLSSTGATGGTKDMSTTADEYYIVDTTQTLVIYRMLVFYQDGLGGNVSEYGNLGAALTNGIEIQTMRRDGTTVRNDLTDGVPVKQNGDWARLCYDYTYQDHGSGDSIYTARWTFANSGRPITLEPGQSFRMIINDDLTALTSHYAVVQGYAVP